MSLSESEVDAIDRWVHPAALGRLCDEVEQIIGRHVTAALTEAADAITYDAVMAHYPDVKGLDPSHRIAGMAWLQEAARIVRDRTPPPP